MNNQIVGVLVNIRSVHNVASIFRTADAAGISRLYLVGITPSPLDRFGNLLPQFKKVALGAERSVKWEKMSGAPAAVKKLFGNLTREGYGIYVVEQARGAATFTHTRPKKKIALVVGNEVLGLPKSILNRADQILEIPMFGKKESLNVAVAFGIAAYHIRLAGTGF